MNQTTEENIRHEGDYVLKRTDPYGFWHIEKSAGSIPKDLSGQSFTSTNSARDFLRAYLVRQRQNKETSRKDK